MIEHTNHPQQFLLSFCNDKVESRNLPEVFHHTIAHEKKKKKAISTVNISYPAASLGTKYCL